MAPKSLIALQAIALGCVLTGVQAHGHLSGVIGKGTNAGLPRPVHKLGAFYPDAYPPFDCRDCTPAGPGKDGYDQAHASAYTDGSDQFHMFRDTGLLQCHGKPKGKANMTLTAGETIEVTWDITIGHPGPSALYMSFDGDKTWVLLTQTVDSFIKYNKANPDVWDDKAENGMILAQKITLPANLPASTSATLRGEWLNLQAPEFYSSCIDVITTGPGKIPTDGFKIEGTSKGPSHLPNLLSEGGTPYKGPEAGTDVAKNGIGYTNYVQNIWLKKLGGPKVYDFGKNDYTYNVEMTRDKVNFPPHLMISSMNPAGATPAVGGAKSGAPSAAPTSAASPKGDYTSTPGAWKPTDSPKTTAEATKEVPTTLPSVGNAKPSSPTAGHTLIPGGATYNIPVPVPTRPAGEHTAESCIPKTKTITAPQQTVYVTKGVENGHDEHETRTPKPTHIVSGFGHNGTHPQPTGFHTKKKCSSVLPKPSTPAAAHTKKKCSSVFPKTSTAAAAHSTGA